MGHGGHGMLLCPVLLFGSAFGGGQSQRDWISTAYTQRTMARGQGPMDLCYGVCQHVKPRIVNDIKVTQSPSGSQQGNPTAVANLAATAKPWACHFDWDVAWATRLASLHWLFVILTISFHDLESELDQDKYGKCWPIIKSHQCEST